MPATVPRPSYRSGLADALGINFANPLASNVAMKSDLPVIGSLMSNAATKADALPGAPTGALSTAGVQQRSLSALDPGLHHLVNGGATPGALLPTTATPNIQPAADDGTDALAAPDGMSGNLQAALASYPDALKAARNASGASLDQQQGIYQGYIDTLSKPEPSSMWGKFGVALMQPTNTGTWGESFGNAASAAMQERDRERALQAEKDAKKMTASLALAKLTGERGNAQLDQFRDQIDVYKTTREVNGMLADDRLIGNGLTPGDDLALIADYNKNPGKYKGTGGQQMVAAAVERQRAIAATAASHDWDLQKIRLQMEADIAKEQAKHRTANGALGDLKPTEEKMLSQAHSNVLSSRDNMDLLNTADQLDQNGQVMSGWAPRMFAATGAKLGEYLPQEYLVPDWLFGSPEQQSSTQQYYQIMDPASLERIKQNLPGAMSDSDVRLALGVYADPAATADARRQARETIRRKFEAQDKVSRAQMQRLIGTDATADLLGETSGTGSGGTSSGGSSLTPQQADVLHQAVAHAKANNAYGGVAKRLNDMGLNITADQLRNLTPAQIDALVKGN